MRTAAATSPFIDASHILVRAYLIYATSQLIVSLCIFYSDIHNVCISTILSRNAVIEPFNLVWTSGRSRDKKPARTKDGDEMAITWLQRV